MQDHLSRLREMRERALQGGGPERVEQQHAKGKMTARERLALLLDHGSFQELGALASHNVSDFGLDDLHYTYQHGEGGIAALEPEEPEPGLVGWPPAAGGDDRECQECQCGERARRFSAFHGFGFS